MLCLINPGDSNNIKEFYDKTWTRNKAKNHLHITYSVEKIAADFQNMDGWIGKWTDR